MTQPENSPNTPEVPANVTVRDYDLPDRALLEAAGPAFDFLVWVPGCLAVVLGRGNEEAEQSVFADRVRTDGVPVYRRPSGGEAVVLSPGTVAVSAVHRSALQASSRSYFHVFNEAVRAALAELGVADVSHRGISDLALGDRKIMGSSIHRNRHRVFYHAVLNLALNTDAMEAYLRPPARQPDYRLGRPHREFVTSLSAAGFPFSAETITTALTRAFQNLPPDSFAAAGA